MIRFSTLSAIRALDQDLAKELSISLAREFRRNQNHIRRLGQTAQERLAEARRLTLGADKGYDAAAFVADMRALNVTPHIAQNISGRRFAVDARTARYPRKTYRRAIRLGHAPAWIELAPTKPERKRAGAKTRRRVSTKRLNER